MNTDNTKNIQKLLLVIAVLKHPHNSKKNIKSFFRKKYNLGRQKGFYRNLFKLKLFKIIQLPEGDEEDDDELLLWYD